MEGRLVGVVLEVLAPELLSLKALETKCLTSASRVPADKVELAACDAMLS